MDQGTGDAGVGNEKAFRAWRLLFKNPGACQRMAKHDTLLRSALVSHMKEFLNPHAYPNY
jgi:hypothetical protein